MGGVVSRSRETADAGYAEAKSKEDHLMKSYWSIPGWKNAPHNMPCLGFEKFDGSNIRAEWSKKAGWYKFGSRNVLLDESHPDLGSAIPLFRETLADRIDKVFRDRKSSLPEFDQAVVYCEFYGAQSFAG